MIARLQRITTLGLLFGALAWATCFAFRGLYLLALAGFILILFGYAVVLGLQFLCLARFGADSPLSDASAQELIRAWAHEVLYTPLVFGWRQPYRSCAERHFIPAEASGQRGVVLVHGFLCNRGLWNPWMATLRRHRVPFVAANLEPPGGDLDCFTSTLECAVERIETATGQRPVVVAHSMAVSLFELGGLRTWIDGARCRS
jgi:hypothetical protein